MCKAVEDSMSWQLLVVKWIRPVSGVYKGKGNRDKVVHYHIVQKALYELVSETREIGEGVIIFFFLVVHLGYERGFSGE